MESRYQEKWPRALPSAQWWSQRQRDPNFPFPSPALPFEARPSLETLWTLKCCRGWYEKLTWLWFRSLVWGLPPARGISPLPPWRTALCQSLWDRLLLKSSELLRLIWVWTNPAAGQICVCLEKRGSAHARESWQYTGKVADLGFCMFLRRLTASRPQAVTATEPCPKSLAKMHE